MLTRFLRTAPEPAGVPSPTAVRIRVRSDRRLTPAEFAAAGGERSGRAWWWLRHQDGWFVREPLPRGTESVDVELWLEPGRYTLGVGAGPSAIRVRVDVAPPPAD